MRASHCFVAVTAYSLAKVVDGLARWHTSVSGPSDVIVFGVVGACFALLTLSTLEEESDR